MMFIKKCSMNLYYYDKRKQKKREGEKKVKEDFIVDGIHFSDSQEAKKAQKELDGIEYIKKTNDMKNPKVLLALYNKFIEHQLFQTEIGKRFLTEIKEELIKSPSIKKGEISGYQEEIEKRTEDRKKKEEVKKKVFQIEKEKKEREKYKYKYYNSLILNIILVITIILLFVLTATSGNVTILNYENKLLDKYSSWQMQLEQKEKELKEREKALIEKEKY